MSGGVDIRLTKGMLWRGRHRVMDIWLAKGVSTWAGTAIQEGG